MTNEAKHTPTPWQYRLADMGKCITIDSDKGEIEVAVLPTEINGKAISLSNAAFIVRACNAHDGLVAVLEEIVYFWDYHQAGGSLLGDKARKILALAKAGGL